MKLNGPYSVTDFYEVILSILKLKYITITILEKSNYVFVWKWNEI